MNSVKFSLVGLALLGLVCYIGYWGFNLLRGA